MLTEHTIGIAICIFFIATVLAFFAFSGDEKESGRIGFKDAENFQCSLTEAISKLDILEPSRVIRIGRDDILALLEVIEDVKNFTKPINFSVQVNNKTFEIIIENRENDSDGKKQ